MFRTYKRNTEMHKCGYLRLYDIVLDYQTSCNLEEKKNKNVAMNMNMNKERIS